jgi:hypothetical protein
MYFFIILVLFFFEKRIVRKAQLTSLLIAYQLNPATQRSAGKYVWGIGIMPDDLAPKGAKGFSGAIRHCNVGTGHVT